MILFPLIFGCIPQEDGNQFGVASSASEQNFDTEEATSELEDSSAEESDTPLDSTPFSVDSSVVCGNRTVGTEVGDCALNFALLNQDAELVDLHSFVGSVVFLDLSDFTWGGCKDSGPSFNQFYLNHKARQLVSVQALHNASFEELQQWDEEYLGDVQLLLDENSLVFEEYKLNHYRPQFIVIDRGMSIVYKGYLTDGKQQAEDTVLSLLE